MLADIFNTPAIVSINGKEYKAEFDFESYAVLETLTGKSMHKICSLLLQENLPLNDSIELICCSLLKHQKQEDMKAIHEYFHTNLYVIRDLLKDIAGAYVSPLLPPEVYQATEEIKKSEKKKKAKK